MTSIKKELEAGPSTPSSTLGARIAKYAYVTPTKSPVSRPISSPLVKVEQESERERVSPYFARIIKTEPSGVNDAQRASTSAGPSRSVTRRDNVELQEENNPEQQPLRRSTRERRMTLQPSPEAHGPEGPPRGDGRCRIRNSTRAPLVKVALNDNQEDEESASETPESQREMTRGRQTRIRQTRGDTSRRKTNIQQPGDTNTEIRARGSGSGSIAPRTPIRRRRRSRENSGSLSSEVDDDDDDDVGIPPAPTIPTSTRTAGSRPSPRNGNANGTTNGNGSGDGGVTGFGFGGGSGRKRARGYATPERYSHMNPLQDILAPDLDCKTPSLPLSPHSTLRWSGVLMEQ